MYAVSFWSLLAFLTFLILDLLVLPIYAGKYKTRVITPSVEGLMATEAESNLAKLNLGLYWKPKGQYSSKIPKGAVLSQVPKPGREVKEGRTIVLTLSKGLREVAIPSFRGKSMRQVEISLAQMGLVQGRSIRSKHKSIPRGVVIRSVPKQNAWVKIGSEVKLVVSSGKGSGILLPNLIGRSSTQGQSILDSLGFTHSESVQDTTSDELLPETIVYQYPRGGEYLAKGTAISLKVSP